MAEMATIEKEEVKTVKRTKIAEDTDLHVVRFQNMEQAGVPLECSLGPPISDDIRNYVFKDGHCYNLGQRIIDHLHALSYPIYENKEDPNFPGSGQTRSMQVGVKKRFALIPENNPEVTVYEHRREKLNHKILPGALQNSPNLPKTVQRSGDVMSGKDVKYMQNENQNLSVENHQLRGNVKDLITKVNMALAENKTMKKEVRDLSDQLKQGK